MQSLSLDQLSAADRLAVHCTSFTFDKLPEQTVHHTRQVVFDFIGSVLGGYQTELGRRSTDYVMYARQGDEATIVGDGRRCAVEGAAWVNAANSCILGMTETHRKCGHVASEIVPAALAIGEQRQLSGKQIITAIVAGYEVFGAIQPAVRDYQRTKGLDTKGQVGTLASAVTTGVALGLDATTLRNALALATDMACGTEQYAYDPGLCDTEGLLAGYAAANGIAAARMAEFGFKGPSGALDGPYGYYSAFGSGYNADYLEQLGRQFIIDETALKPHSGCRHVHACVDATQALLRTIQPELNSIVAIEVGTYRNAVTPEFRVNYHPDSVESAGFSLPVTVSVVLARGSWYLEDIASYTAPEVRRLMPLVTVYEDVTIQSNYPQMNGCIVRVQTRDEMWHEGRVNYAKGEPENMMTAQELEDKFRKLAGNLLPEAQINRLLDLANRVDELDDIGELVRATIRP